MNQQQKEQLRIDAMNDHVAKRDARIKEVLQVPMVKDYVSKHSGAKTARTYVKRTVLRKAVHA